MRPATGPLQTGTYISDLVDAPGKYTTVKGDRSKLALTDDSRTEDAAKWFIETLGNDVYRVTVTNFNVTLTPDLGQKTVDIGKGSSEWIIKETRVPGVYSGGPASRPDLHAYVERGDAHIDMKLSESTTDLKVRFFRIDE
ncbi:hypothetical protein F5887DRAFT_919952 [Amanita rubescens]|nr:hypothetical protein F5887DRAFT_919952 [Amanita rubescens]